MRPLLAGFPLGLVVVALACGSSKTTGGAAADGGADSGRVEGGGGGEAGTCRANVGNRPTAAACASNADAGVVDAGPTTCGQPIVPHDACLSDADCAGGHGAIGVCVCQAPHGEGCGTGVVTGNVCVPANCHVDSDCSPCARCRVEESCGATTGYYCESPADECSSNADCGSGFCTFQGDHFACQTNVACAG